MEEEAVAEETATAEAENSDVGENTDDLLHLECTAELTVKTRTWREVVKWNLPVTTRPTPSSYEAEVSLGTVICFHSKDEWEDITYQHRIFVVRGDDCVHIFDDVGNPFVLGSFTNSDGVQALTGDSGFLASWEHDMYCVAAYENDARGRADADADGADGSGELFKEGQRIALVFKGGDGESAAWYGGFIADNSSQEDDVSTTLVAFDDGELKYYQKSFLTQNFAKGTLTLLDEAEGGIVHNATGKPMAKRVAYLKEGRMKGARAVGVLIGDTGHTLAGAVVHEAFRCCPSTNASGRPMRSSAARPAPVRGFQTFIRHDVLYFLKGKDTDTFHSQASVVGLTHQEGSGKSDGCKYLLLAERGSLTFFVGKWHEWKRATKVADADAEDDDKVEQLTEEESRAVEAAYEKTDVFRTMDSMAQVKLAADKLSSKGPPLLMEARIAALQADRAKKAEKGAQPKKPRPDFLDLVTADDPKKKPRPGRDRGTRPQQDEHATEIAARAEAARAEAQRLAEAEIFRLKSELLKAQQQVQQPMLRRTLPGDNPAAVETVVPICVPLACAPAAIPMAMAEPSIAPASAPPPPREPLPWGWKEATSAAGVTYYYNKSTNQSQYHPPSVPSPPLPPPSGPPLMEQPRSPVRFPTTMSMPGNVDDGTDASCASPDDASTTAIRLFSFPNTCR